MELRTTAGALSLAPLDGTANEVAECFHVDRLCEKILRALLHSPHREINRPVARHDENGDGGIERLESVEELERIAVGKAKIGDDDVRPARNERSGCGFQAICVDDAEPLHTECSAHRKPKVHVVLDDEHFRQRFARGHLLHQERQQYQQATTRQ